MLDRKRIGRKGEKLARRYLKRQGYRILAANFSCPAGEIDLIALTGKTIAFVEVKTLTADEHAEPEEKVTPAKQARIRKAARAWLAQRRAEAYSYRFDTIAVTLLEGQKPRIRHTPDAFRGA